MRSTDKTYASDAQCTGIWSHPYSNDFQYATQLVPYMDRINVRLPSKAIQTMYRKALVEMNPNLEEDTYDHAMKGLMLRRKNKRIQKPKKMRPIITPQQAKKLHQQIASPDVSLLNPVKIPLQPPFAESPPLYNDRELRCNLGNRVFVDCKSNSSMEYPLSFWQ